MWLYLKYFFFFFKYLQESNVTFWVRTQHHVYAYDISLNDVWNLFMAANHQWGREEPGRRLHKPGKLWLPTPALGEVGKVKRSGGFSIWKMFIHKGSKEHLASVPRLYKIEHHWHAGSQGNGSRVSPTAGPKWEISSPNRTSSYL